MSDYCVTAVRYVNQELTAVQIGQGKGNGPWVHEPHEADVGQVIRHIEGGDTVHTLLRGDGKVEPGPRLKIVTGAQGGKSLALDNAPSDCLELSDLERF